MIKATPLEEAEALLAEYLVYHQYGAPAGISPKKLKDHLARKMEHFLRRDEMQSAYYGKWDEPMLCGCGNPFDDGVIHIHEGPCYLKDSEAV